MTDKALKKLIQKSKYVSFDIFDTLVLRNVLFPEDIFGIIEAQYNYLYGKIDINFQKARIEAEKEARNKIKGIREEIQFDEIYEQIKIAHKLDNTCINRLKELELQAEINICTPNNYMKKLFYYALDAGKKIILNSDMYLPEEVVLKILDSAGYKCFERLFLSSKEGFTKYNGSMYDHITKDLECKPYDIVHIGDNKHSDYDKAIDKGFKAYFYQSCTDRALDCEDFRDSGYISMINEPIQPEISIFLGLIVNKFYSERCSKRDIWYKTGYGRLGIMTYSFIEWLISNAKSNNLDKIFFLAREGLILKEIYDVFSNYRDNAIPSEYVFASRRLLHIATLDKNADINSEEADNIFEYILTLNFSNLKELFELLNIEFEDKIAEKAGFNSGSQKVDIVKDYERLKVLWGLIFERVKNSALNERNILLSYFNSKEADKISKLGIVDIGWNGRLQNSIKKLLDYNSNKPEIFGYYMGLFPKALEFKAKGMNILGYYSDGDYNCDYYKLLNKAVPILEYLFTAPHGSIIGIKQEDGEFKALYDRDSEPEKILKINQIGQGIKDFTTDMLQLSKNYKWLTITGENAFIPLERLINTPTYEEAHHLGTISHNDGHDMAQIPVIKLPNKFISIFNPESKNKCFEKSLWKEGFNRLQRAKSEPAKSNSLPLTAAEALKSKKIEKNIRNFTRKYKGKRICFYGAGIFAEEFLRKYNLKELDIIGFIDKNPAKKGLKIAEYKIYGIEDIPLLKPDVIILTVIDPKYVLGTVNRIQKEHENSFEIKIDLFTA